MTASVPRLRQLDEQNTGTKGCSSRSTVACERAHGKSSRALAWNIPAQSSGAVVSDAMCRILVPFRQVPGTVLTTPID